MTQLRSGGRVIVAGIGNNYRRDDGAGPAVAERLGRQAPRLENVSQFRNPVDLLGLWDEADLAVIVDSVRSGAAPGTVKMIDLSSDGSLPGAGTSAGSSTHGIGLLATLRLARTVNSAPRRVVVITIDGVEFGRGVGLCPAVERGVAEAAEMVLELIG